ncbi:hypothetical protein FHU34_114387 [Micromonospora taraxaci]|uniref:Uncharacterized protein n=1 Tax=Micromonospora taraxaci TaxID=1316803 RepID=A0A561W565_9ACTN|nr:hypothetical protein FHU34_114387 [Micromonospora taraxaci]
MSPAAWDEKGECECHLYAAALRASVVTEGPVDLFIEIPIAGKYRARLYVKGREDLIRAFEGWSLEPAELNEGAFESMDNDEAPTFPRGFEKFLIQLWPRG